MQRKVNRSDSDYHYGKEKYKRNVYKMMLKCKQREVMLVFHIVTIFIYYTSN